MAEFVLNSGSFEGGKVIPRKFGYKHGNTSPSLAFSGIPQNTASLALVMDDPDAMIPAGKVWVHWLVWNIAPSAKFKEGKVPSGCIQGVTDFGEVCYGGPAPPDKEHTYVFKLYALDIKVELAAGATKAQLEEAITGHIISQTVLRGSFSP